MTARRTLKRRSQQANCHGDRDTGQRRMRFAESLSFDCDVPKDFINLKTAQVLHLTIPASALARADQIME